MPGLSAFPGFYDGCITSTIWQCTVFQQAVRLQCVCNQHAPILEQDNNLSKTAATPLPPLASQPQAASARVRGLGGGSRIEELESRLLFSADLAPLAVGDIDTASAQHSLLDSAAMSATDQAQSTRIEIVVIDKSVPDADTLLRDICAQLEASGATLKLIELDDQRDGVQQISDALAACQPGSVGALHLITHGSAAQLQMGATNLNASTLIDHAGQLAGWSTQLARGADLLLYGCNVAADAQGQAFVSDLQLLTGADVAASTNLTGARSLGGDWVLEYQVGQIQTMSLGVWGGVAQWQHTLATYTVTSTADTASAGTLRWAITQANANAGADTIEFSISSGTAGAGSDAGAYVITLSSALPTITEAVSIDASTQSGYVAGGLHTVVLDGNDAAAYGFNLSNTSDGSTIRGLVIRNFTSYGIYMPSGSDSQTIVGNYIGSFYADGSNAGTGKGNASTGIYSHGANAVIGGTTAADRNVISGNSAGYGIYLATGASGTVVQGNYIGTDAAGTSVFSTTNPDYGIMIETSATNITIGGSAAGAGNVISGHTREGIWVTTTGDVVIQGNYIGTDYTGTVDLGNTRYGIYLDDGGTATITDNVISGNNLGGIYAANGGVTVQGNIIGLNASGTAALGNGGAGIELRTGGISTIGGTTASERNVISGNSTYGIQIESHYAHVIKGNYVGVASDGSTLIGNGSHGVYIGIGDQTIGGTGASDGNVIAGNTGAGIAVASGTGSFYYRNSIYGNGGLGIDVDVDGVSVNDYGDGDGGANYSNNYPVISSAVINGASTTITGSIEWYAHSTADTIYIEFYASPSLDASGYGEGKTYLGATTVTTDATTGDATFSVTLTGASEGNYITAVASVLTSYEGASEFSPGLAVTTAANAPSGKLIWTDNDQFDSWVSNWTGSGFTAPGVTGLDLGDDVLMMAVAEAPTRDEFIMIGAADVSGEIQAIVWDGSAWTAPLGIPVAAPSASASQYHSFALAYESQSGDALLVWDNGNTGTAGLSYAIWNGTGWSSINTITSPASGEPYEMKLVSSPVEDQMILAVTTSSGNNYALVWNGASWSSSQTLGTNTSNQYFEINVAYESQSGQAMVVYDASASNSSSIQYRTWDGSNWSSEQTLSAPSGITLTSDVYCTAIASDTGSDRIALAVKDASEDVWLAVWDGSSWGDTLVATTSGIDAPDHHATMAVAFESQSGDVLAVYGKASGPNIYYRTWTSGSGWSSEGTGPSNGGTDIVYATKLWADPYSDTIMLGVQDGGLDLNMTAWDGSSWGTTTTIDSSTGEYYRENFAFAWNINPPPAISNVSGDTLAYTEGDVAAVIDQGTGASVSDGDGSGFNGGTLTVSLVSGSTTAEDVLSVRNQGSGAGQIGVSGSNITYGGTTIGTYGGGSSGADLVITLNAAATDAAVTALAANITYVNTNTSAPSTTTRTARFVVSNASGISSGAADVSITVSAVNDAPVHSVPGAQTTAEDGVLIFSSGNGNLITMSDEDAGSGSLQVSLGVSHGTLTLAGLSGLSFSSGDGTGDATMVFTGTLADINTALAGLSYTPTAGYNGSDTLSIATSDQGNTGSGGNLSDTDSVAITVAALIPTPEPDPTDQPIDEVIPTKPADPEKTLVDADLGQRPPTIVVESVDAPKSSGPSPAMDAKAVWQPAMPHLTYQPEQRLSVNVGEPQSSHVRWAGSSSPDDDSPHLSDEIVLRLLSVDWRNTINADAQTGEDPLSDTLMKRPVKWVDASDELLSMSGQGVQIAGITLSVGMVWWVSRVVGLLTSLTASVPAWQSFDPLPILGASDEEKETPVAFEESTTDETNDDASPEADEAEHGLFDVAHQQARRTVSADSQGPG